MDEAKPLEYALVDMLADPEIDDSVEESIWCIVRYLMQKDEIRKQKAADRERKEGERRDRLERAIGSIQ